MSRQPGFNEFNVRLREFITSSVRAAPGQEQFNPLALELFGLQFEQNEPYRKFCANRGMVPGTLRHWTQIPAVPTAAFKESDLTCIPATERAAVFYSSGTTLDRPSRHLHSVVSLALYEHSVRTWFSAVFTVLQSFPRRPGAVLEGTPDPKLPFLILTPPPGQAPHSSLVHMFQTLGPGFGAGHEFFGRVDATGAWILEFKKVLIALEKAERNLQPVFICGTAFNLVHLLEFLAEHNLGFKLPSESWVLETGGYKGRSREVPRQELYSLVNRRLGISQIIGEYGMSELSSQAYATNREGEWFSGCSFDPDRSGSARSGDSSRFFLFPPWARAQIVSPETGGEVGEGEIGLIRVYDLANAYSVMAVQTEDLGIRRFGGFDMVGRAKLSEPKGCSLLSAGGYDR